MRCDHGHLSEQDKEAARREADKEAARREADRAAAGEKKAAMAARKQAKEQVSACGGGWGGRGSLPRNPSPRSRLACVCVRECVSFLTRRANA